MIRIKRKIYKRNNLERMFTVNNKISILNSKGENHLNMHVSYLEIPFNVSNNPGGIMPMMPLLARKLWCYGNI